MKTQYGICLLLLLWAGWLNSAAAENARVALVIGNSTYQKGALKNPMNDASDIAAVLRENMGFTVIEHTNLSRSGMLRAVRTFRKALARHDQPIALFFYAGHGIQAGEHNYLIPIDADIEGEFEIAEHGVALNTVLKAMASARPKLSIALLDACRNNPYERSFRSGRGRGLARVDTGSGTIIGYATAPGSVAEDGDGRNSPYTTVLKRKLALPRISVTDMLNDVGWEVKQQYGQEPWVSNSPVPRVCLGPGGCRGGSDDRKTLAFTVKTSPAEAHVRILNIAPKYQPGMELAPGRYRVEVTHPGYAKHLSSHELKAGSEVYVVELEAVRQETSSPSSPSPSKTRQAFEPEMVPIKGGCYQMGSPANEKGRDDDERQHRVCVEDFWMGKYEVTQAQWRAVMGKNPSYFKDCDDCPVEVVSWNEVQEYIKKLNARTSGGYRLPTEAEWEYAARAGTQTAYWWGGDIGRNKANCYGCGSRWDYEKTAPVGSFKANPWGLYDTVGNVWEWTCSAYEKNYGGAEQNCAGGTGSFRVFRGGGWGSSPRFVRAALRLHGAPASRQDILGFRLLRK